MNLPCEVVPLTERDLPAVARLEQCCFAHPWSEQGLWGTLQSGHAVFLVAKVGEEVLGYLGMEYVLDEGSITNVAVFPEARRQGVAAALLGALQKESAALGLVSVTLEVRAGNEPAIALYRKFGFLSVGRRKNFYTTPTEDAILMTAHWDKADALTRF